MAGLTVLFVVALNLDNIASRGSAVALLASSVIAIGHFRVHRETGASLVVLVIALLSTAVTFVVLCTTTLVGAPATAVPLGA